MKPIIGFSALVVLAFGVSGCLPYLYKERAPALISGIDIDQSLDVAQAKFEDEERRGFDVLTVWALRDQAVTEAQAIRINDMYLRNVDWVGDEDTRGNEFGLWHLTWAIGNLYRFGNDTIKAALQPAYEDADRRVETIDRSYAIKHFRGETIYSGPAHGLGKRFTHKHLVVPGNDDYLQSFDEYLAKR